MSDKVELLVDNKKIEHFISYHISADLYTPADFFHLDLSNPDIVIKKGKLAEVYVNGTKELTGIVEKTHRRVHKDGVSLSVQGRDLMGLLIDTHCEPPWPSINNMKLQNLAELLLKRVPFINRKTIEYQKNVTGKIKGKKKSATNYIFSLDAAQKIGQIEPGMTIFDVLRNFALSRGLLFYCKADGTLVFGRPMAKGEPEFFLTMKRDGKGNNVISSEVIDDISRRYSRIYVVGQQQGGQSSMFATAINKPSIPKDDPTFPFHKPYVCLDNNDNVSPMERARLIIEKQRREGRQFNYTVGRHSQNNHNWAINSMCRITDEVQEIDGKSINGDYLIYGRTFEMNKSTGPITRLKLGEPGIIA